VQGAPVAHAPFQCPSDAIIGKAIWVSHLQMPQQGHGLDSRITLEDHQQHWLPDRLERISNGAPVFGLAL
jgi:hypothetical protein